MMAYENITVATTGQKATITINRPNALNALNSQTLGEISDAFAELEQAGKVRACIFTGGGEKAFIAGADIAELKRLNVVTGKRFVEIAHALFTRIETSPLISIAAINGFALGGRLRVCDGVRYPYCLGKCQAWTAGG